MKIRIVKKLARNKLACIREDGTRTSADITERFLTLEEGKVLELEF